MIIETKKLQELIPADYNPRKDLQPGDPEYEKLKRSIDEFGYVDPIIWNKRTGRICGGHQRFKILKAQGVEEAEVVIVDFDEEKEKAFNIALNKVNGDWDKDKLALLITDLQASDFDVSLTGFDPAELDDLMGSDSDAKDDNFDVQAELEKPAFSLPGDIWTIGKHRVICGDSTDPMVFERLLQDTKVNLVCTDAPYFVDLNSTSGKIKNDNLNDKEAYEFLMKVFTNLKNAMAIDASIYEFYATMKSRIFYDAFEDAGFKVGAGLVWKKPRAPFMRTDWKFNMEPIIFGWRKDGKHKWYGDQKQTAVFEFDGIKDSKKDGFGHPSSKPIPLIAYLIEQSTATNGLVLDCFLGSAPTLMACEQINRTCYGIELEPKFVDVAVKRYIEFTGSDQDVFVIRDGQKLPYSSVAPTSEETE